MATGKLYLIGAGPGDPDLLTVKAQRLITQANVIFYANSLIPPEILNLAQADCELIPTADQILETVLPLMIERVQAGQLVLRLQSGDPCLYSTLHEQLQALEQANIPIEVIPGISAFQLAAAKLQVELTIPELVQTIILTRISGRTQVPAKEELAHLAAHQASLCLYLSARHVEKAQAELLVHYPPDTPVAICFRLGWPDEQIHVVPLTEMANVTQTHHLYRTTLYLVTPALRPDRGNRSQLYHPNHPRLFRSQAMNQTQP
ncbi:precorrin-4 C(11)-methyltransferase [Synechococcus sp. PCC 6312]|uniref:precorrin-4 C(11)-methyltransferase n=1 Tax=Synechococcus sp. (strain ATCC 27167 / PCC 6312) TaxID=195253 RepID=UPI00029ED82A|nr:precorrin-4 C(11)-methyltransferase [Synechococcus sp. PCC 6312]AFY61301.1 precorrin-4 C11-methyltransferase [Synechococcus sp. PCC 6312]